MGGPASRSPSKTSSTTSMQWHACADGITDFPDPVFSGGGVSFTRPPGIDTSSPQYIQANQISRKLIPAGLPDSGSGG